MRHHGVSVLLDCFTGLIVTATCTGSPWDHRNLSSRGWAPRCGSCGCRWGWPCVGDEAAARSLETRRTPTRIPRVPSPTGTPRNRSESVRELVSVQDIYNISREIPNLLGGFSSFSCGNQGPLLLTRINNNRSNYNHHNEWDEITHPFPNVSGTAVGFGNT